MNAVGAFKIALAEALKSDAGVSALVAHRVFDILPRESLKAATNVASPWIYVGPINATRQDEGACGVGWTVRIRIYAASIEAGRDEAWTVISAAAAALEGATLTLSAGAHAPQILVMQAGDIVDPVEPTLTFIDVTTVVHD